jgi:hypothetical protein
LPTKALLGVQLVCTLAILAFVPGNWAKLLLFIVVWGVTFGAILRAELILYASVSAAFSLMDMMAVRQGAFRFASPNVAGLPVWEFFMWGFYVVHCIRFLGGSPPRGPLSLAVGLATLFALPFMSLTDPWWLFAASGALLLAILFFFHERADFAYLGYMLAIGALVEYTGVWSGQWSYPGNPLGGVPLWFATMWGGVGVFARRLFVPLLRPNPDR